MRILYLHQYFVFPNEPGGTRSYDLARKFYENGYQIEVITSTSVKKFDNGRTWNSIERDGIVIHYLYLPYDNRLSYFKRSLVFIKFLVLSTFKLLKIKADLVLATSTPLTIGVPAVVNKLLSRRRFIFEVRDVWPEAVIAIGAVKNPFIAKLLYFLERIIYKNASAIVPLSVDMQLSILRRYPKLHKKPTVVIENISEIDRFQSSQEGIDLERIVGFLPRFSVLYAGTFGQVNGIEYVINLATRIRKIDPTIVFFLLGDGKEKETIQSLAESQGLLNQNVFIIPPISKCDLPKWYRSVNMGSSFVIDIPQLWANSANKFFDTLAAGKPILINYEGWQATKIREANIGYVLPPKLTDEAALKFVEYTYNRTLIDEQSANAIGIAKSAYSLDIATAKYLKLIEKVMGK